MKTTLTLALSLFLFSCDKESTSKKVQIHPARYVITHPEPDGIYTWDYKYYCENYKLSGSVIEFEDVYGCKHVFSGNFSVSEYK